MAGHSKWNNIKRTKGAQDAKKSAVFSKIYRDIVNAVRIGESNDPLNNPMLRVAVERAKSVNMPNDKIEKALAKGTASDTERLIERQYELTGPGGSIIILEMETDNPARTVSELKTIVNKAGYKLLTEGSISWQFTEYGMITCVKEIVDNFDDFYMLVSDVSGVKDLIQKSDGSVEVLVERNQLRHIHAEINKIINQESADIDATLVKVPDNFVTLNEQENGELDNLINLVSEMSEYRAAWTNVKNR